MTDTATNERRVGFTPPSDPAKGFTFRGKIIGRINGRFRVTIYPYQGHHVRAEFPIDFYFKVEQISTDLIRTFDPDIAFYIANTIKLQHDLILESRRLG